MFPGVHRLRRPSLRTALSLPFVLAALLVPSAVAQAASEPRSVQLDVPSLQGNVDASKAQFNGINRLTAWVRLPAGYDDQPDRQWPVLYLLHGWEDNSNAWLDPKKGSIDTVLPKDFDGIVVMPEGARGWFVNWYADKGNPGQQWGNYLLDEVVPFMEQQFRIAPGRANHAIGGLSMGGYGAVQAVGALPSYFGHAISFSGLLDNQDLAFTNLLNIAQLGWHPGYDSIFGPSTSAYAASLNPKRNPARFAGSRMTLVYGTPPVSVLWSLDVRPRGLAILEIGAQGQARQLVSALKGSGASVFTNNRNNGTHDWPWWRKDLADAVARGLFADPPVTSTAKAKVWTYTTMNQHGNAWGLGYQFPSRPTSEVKFVRRGVLLEGFGRGTVRIAGGAADADSSGAGTREDCTFTVQLPFQLAIPSGC